IHRFSDEFRILLSWVRQTPPDAEAFTMGFLENLQLLEGLLIEGERDGSIGAADDAPPARAMLRFEVLLTPNTVIRRAGLKGAHQLARQVVLHGALTRA